jgi:hypothetical protein
MRPLEPDEMAVVILLKITIISSVAIRLETNHHSDQSFRCYDYQ